MLKKASILLLTVASAFALKTGVYAESVKQIKAETSKVTVQWDYANVTSVQISEDATLDTSDKEGTVRSGRDQYTFDGLKAGKSYFIRVKSNEAWKEVVEVSTCPDFHEIGDIEQIAATKTSATVAWGAAKGATGYDVYLGKENRDKNLKKVLTTADKKAVINISKSAYVKVVPFRTLSNGYVARNADDRGVFTNDIKPVPGKVTHAKQDKSSKGIRITWDKMEDVDGYQLVYSDYNGKRKVKSNFLKAVTIRDIPETRASFLKFKMRAYINVKGKKVFGSWTKEKVILPEVLAYKFKYTSYTSGSLPKVTIQWSKIKGAKKYEVYMSKSYGGPFKKIKTTKKRSLYISKFKGENLAWIQQYYFKVVAVSKIGKKKYKSKTKEVKSWSVNKIHR